MRIGKSVWIAKRIAKENATIPQYEKPQEIILRPNYFTVMPASSGNYLQIIQSGENIYNTWNAQANGNVFFGKIKAGDVMWLDGDKPIESVEKEYGFGTSATAEVKSAVENNFYISIVLERRQNQITK